MPRTSPRTADFVDTRLRRGTYSAGELDAWGDWFAAQCRDVLVYIKHDDEASAPRSSRCAGPGKAPARA